MIVCTNCGFRNEADARFCGGCQEFLEWTGERVGEAAPEPETEPVAAAEAPKGVVERVVERLTGHEAVAEDDAAQASAVEQDAEQAVADDQAVPAVEDAAASLSAEVAERAEREAQEAERARQEAEDHAREQTEATERARQQADEAERVRREAEEQARQEAEETERVKQELEAARAAREEKQKELERELEEAEAARIEAEERARAEAEAAEAAARTAAEAERSRREAEARAAQESEAAEKARRAAALVARPRKPSAATTPRPGSRPVAEPVESAKPAKPQRNGPAGSGADQTKAPSPRPVKPGRTKARRTAPAQEAPTRRLRPGDLVCGQCGEGNDPTRNFCRRCGNTLAEAEVVRAAWWRRLLPKRSPKRYAAGERPGRGPNSKAKGRDALKGARGIRRFVMGGVGKVARVLMLGAFVLGAIGISFNPGLRGSVMGWGEDAFQRVRSVVAPQFERVAPTDVDGSSQLPDHPAEHAIDDTSNRWWAEAAEGDGQGEWLLISFPEPADIAAVGITPGAADPEQFVAQPRPRLLHLVFSNGATADLRLADEHRFQTFDVEGATGVTWVEVQIIEVWRGQSGSDLAITGIEFRARR